MSQTIPVTFVVGSGGGTTTPGIVTPASLTFAYQTGTVATWTTLPSQSIVVSGTGTVLSRGSNLHQPARLPAG